MDGDRQTDRLSRRGALRQPDFRKVWSGQVISELGSRITREGLPTTAVLLLGATPAQMGLLTAMNGFAVLTFSLFAGWWVDRVRRKSVLIAADLVRAALLATIPLAAVFAHLHFWHLCAVAALAGTATVFFDVAYQSFLPSLLEGDDLLEANSKLAVSSSIAEILGPSITGLLIQLLTAPRAILLDSLSFLASAAMFLLVRRPEPPPSPPAAHEPLGLQITAGFRAIWRDPTLRPLAAYSATIGLAMGSFATLYVYYALQVLHLTPAMLGFVIAVGGVSALLGAVLAERLPRRFGVIPTMIAAAIYSAVTSWMMPLAHGSPLVCALFLAAGQCGDAGWGVFFVNEISVRQRIAPPDVLGRVNAVMQLLFRGMLPFSALLGGWIATVAGPRAALRLSAVGVSLAVGWLFLLPSRSRRELFPHES